MSKYQNELENRRNKMNFDDLQLSRVILELRYDDGFLYWDRCGATVLEFKNKFPEWRWEGTSTELTRFMNIKRNTEFIFSINSIRFIQNEVENLNQFKETAEEITPLIVEKLEIKKFKRVGNRYQYVFPLENSDQGREIIQKSSLVEIPEEKLTLFSGKTTKTAFVIHLENENLHYRIELVGIERIGLPKNIKIDERFNPKYGLRVDVDIASVNEVNVSDFNCSDFIQSNKKFLEDNLIKFI